jgi:hypothetical protein
MSAGVRRLAVGVAGAAVTVMGLISLTSIDGGSVADSVQTPLAPETSTPASYAPVPIDCSDPNNSINCSSGPIDSPLVDGPAAPGSPFRDNADDNGNSNNN